MAVFGYFTKPAPAPVSSKPVFTKSSARRNKSQKKKLQKAASAFRRQNPRLYAACVYKCYMLAQAIRSYGSDV